MTYTIFIFDYAAGCVDKITGVPSNDEDFVTNLLDKNLYDYDECYWMAVREDGDNHENEYAYEDLVR